MDVDWSLKPHWKELKEEIKKAWPRLSIAEIEGTKGNMKKIEALIKLNYFKGSREVALKLEEIFNEQERLSEKQKESISGPLIL
jgi:hypothetical protein